VGVREIMIKFSDIIKKERAVRKEPPVEKEEKFKIPQREKPLPLGAPSYAELLDFSQGIWNKIENNEKIVLEDLKNKIVRILESLTSTSLVSKYWEDIIADYPVENYFSEHSLNVCLLSLAMGMENKYGKAELIGLGVASLLHEIGMVSVPKEILLNGKLSAEDKENHIRQHPIVGYQKLMTIEGIGKDILLAVRQEHERKIGNGYPAGDKDGQIHEWAKIIGLADTFEAMTHSRSFRKGQFPFKVVSEIIKVNREDFARSVLKLFLRQISLYPIGTWVKLSTGEVAKVTRTIPDFPNRPEVEIHFDPAGDELKDPRRFDLSQQSLYSIQEVLTPEEIEKIE